MPFSRLRKVRAPEQVAEAVRDRILSGTLKPGERLPGERDLALQFGVGRPTVREALKALEGQRLVEIRHGGGVVVLDYHQADLSVLPDLLLRDGRVDRALLDDLLEVRQVCGVALARLAAQRAAPADIERLRQQLEGLKKSPPGDAESLGDRDFEFFLCLATAARNRVFRFVLNALKLGYRVRRSLFAGLFADAGRMLQTHKAVVDAVAAHDATAAAEAMERYLGGSELRTPPV